VARAGLLIFTEKSTEIATVNIFDRTYGLSFYKFYICFFLSVMHNVRTMLQGTPEQRSGRGAVKTFGAMQIYKKNPHQLCLFLFGNDFDTDLKNNTRNYRKLF